MNQLKKRISEAYSKFSVLIHQIWAVLFPSWYAKYYYKLVTHKKLNLKNPQDYNEKVQWLKIYSDTSQWTVLADKYRVRQYIEKCGLSDILVELYGVWSKAEDIDFTILPDNFVLKSNNGCGTNILIYDKKEMDFDYTRRLLKEWLRKRIGLVDFQPHMWNIDRRIIAEELLQDTYNKELSTSIIDYKIFCFHGEPEIISVLYNRKNIVVGSPVNGKGSIDKLEKVYDLKWNSRSDVLSHPFPGHESFEIPKPKCLNEMLSIARILSKPFPQVRVDLYEVNSKVYFGELTFTSGGLLDFTPQYLQEMGDKINLSLAKRRTKLFII